MPVGTGCILGLRTALYIPMCYHVEGLPAGGWCPPSSRFHLIVDLISHRSRNNNQKKQLVIMPCDIRIPSQSLIWLVKLSICDETTPPMSKNPIRHSPFFRIQAIDKSISKLFFPSLIHNYTNFF